MNRRPTLAGLAAAPLAAHLRGLPAAHSRWRRAHLPAGPGGVTEIGLLPGFTVGRATGIDARGQVLGLSEQSEKMRAFGWGQEAMTDLGGDTEAPAINNAGQVVGGQHRFLRHKGVMIDLGTLNGRRIIEATRISPAATLPGPSNQASRN